MYKDVLLYCKYVSKHFYVVGFSVLIGGLGGIQDLTNAFSDEVVIPTWVWVSVLVFGLMSAQYLAWRDMKIEKDQRRRYEILQDTLHKLALHRDTLIRFQNRRAANANELEAWKQEFNILRDGIIKILDEEISPAEARLYAHIGLFTAFVTTQQEGLTPEQHAEYDNYRGRAIRDHQWLTTFIMSYRGKHE